MHKKMTKVYDGLARKDWSIAVKRHMPQDAASEPPDGFTASAEPAIDQAFTRNLYKR